MTAVIKNVMVFDGNILKGPESIAFENGKITDQKSGEQVIDGTGCTLLPGLIDSHIHLNSVENLKQAAKNGVTTMLDMMTDSTKLVDSLRNIEGLTDIRSCYQPVISKPGEMLIASLGNISAYVSSVDETKTFIQSQLDKGADYIKLILESPPLVASILSPQVVEETVQYSHKHNKLVFAHTTSVQGFRIAASYGVDVLNHIPKDEILPTELIDEIKEKNLIVIPTMVMQKGMLKALKRLMP